METRQSPDELLQNLFESQHDGGHLKIFFGYAAGVGKTYAMLEAAHLAKQKGMDVVVGYVEPHPRPKTQLLLQGLECLPILRKEHHGILVNEFDLDQALQRKPQLILVDELAHTNAHGSRHAKRYQDIAELLKAGIDVYTTLNVQHIESLNDKVASITNITVKERIPDSVFNHADSVEMIDIEPADLLERLKEGEIYKKEQAKKAMRHFFSLNNLTALREIALRRCADHVNQLSEHARKCSKKDYHTDEHLLVCLSSAPSNAGIVRTAARMAEAFNGRLSALYVETESAKKMEEADKKRLLSNMRLAEQLGAVIETVYGNDVSYQIAEYARLSGISTIVIGSSSAMRRYLFDKPTLTERLMLLAPNLDIHVIPDTAAKNRYTAPFMNTSLEWEFSGKDLVKTFLVLGISTLIGMIFFEMHFSDANIISIYLLGVLITAIITSGFLYSVIASLSSVLIFSFFFTAPYFSFMADDHQYPITFLIMFSTAIITSSLGSRLKRHASGSAQAAFRTKVLFDTNQLLQKADNDEEILKATARQLIKLLSRTVVIYPIEKDHLAPPKIFPSGEYDANAITSENEKAVAQWVLKNNKHAGATTDTLSSSKCLYLAIRLNENVYGVVGIHIQEIPLDAFEKSVLLSILGECALAMENAHNAYEKEQAAVLIKNEQLRATLLRSISHDLRTPLTSICGNASNLISNSASYSENALSQIYADIYEDSMWLISLVENLLSVTRIEEGKMSLNMGVELIDDIIAEALRHIKRSKDHIITVESQKEIMLVKADAHLIVQVLINLIDNAVSYTPAGSHITLRTRRQGKKIITQVIDDGMGIPDKLKDKVFEMFYSGEHKIADSRRNFGLGLFLCRSIITAHDGHIHVSDNKPHGAIFTFDLPIKEAESGE